MKKTLRTLLMGLAALLAGNALTSCSNDDELQVAPEEQKGYVEFSLSRGADTRTAYTLNDKNGLDAKWSEGDKVVIFYNGSSEDAIIEEFDMVRGAGTATATFAKEDSQLADKSGDIEIAYRPNYDGSKSYSENIFDFSIQEGTLENLGKYDCFVFFATLTNGKISLLEKNYFDSTMAILRFPTDIDFGIGTITSDFVLSGGANMQALYDSPDLGDITVEGVSFTDGKLSQDLYISVWGDMAPSTIKVGGKTFVIPNELNRGKIYNFAESDLTDMSKEPLTLEAVSNDATVYINNPLKLTIGYRLLVSDEIEEAGSFTEDFNITMGKGDKLQLFGDNARYARSLGTSGYTNIQCSDDCYVYGNIMSLIDSEGYATKTELTEDYTFSCLFWNNTHIKNHDSKALMLPATTLVQYCYSRMFYGCSGLTAAPELPATNLAIACYYYMFYGCTGLTTAPELPATALANICYNSMFVGCTSLTTAPELPATKLVESCYFSMFYGCTSLKAVTCLATDISAVNCIGSWLYGVAAKGTFTKAAEMTNWTPGNSGIPDGWTINNK